MVLLIIDLDHVYYLISKGAVVHVLIMLIKINTKKVSMTLKSF